MYALNYDNKLLQCNLKLRILAGVFYKEMVNKVLPTGDKKETTIYKSAWYSLRDCTRLVARRALTVAPFGHLWVQ